MSKPILYPILLLLITSITGAWAESSKPNIILVMADDQGWGDTGYNGHPVVKTPHLDEMARHSLRFDHFHAGAPVCSPTRASVLTGRNNNRTGVLNHGHFMKDAEVALPAVLKKEAGYVTGHFGKWHVGSVQENSATNPGARGYDEWVVGPNFFDSDPYLSRNGIVEQIKGQSSAIIIDETLKFLEKHKDGDAPMFAMAWFSSPHDPHHETPADPKMYEGHKDAPYFLEITALDEQVGRLRSELRKMEIHENTIFWYCSDNGGLRAESSGGRNRKGSIYQGGLRVPSLLEWPGTIQPDVALVPSSSSDMFPTLLSLVAPEWKSERPMDGIDLMPIIKTGTTERDGIGFWRHPAKGRSTWSDRINKAIMDAQKSGQPSPSPERITGFPRETNHPTDSFPGHSAWLEWPWKLHRIEKGAQVKFELYDLSTDPMEAEDAAENQTKRVGEMKVRMLEWLGSVVESMNGDL